MEDTLRACSEIVDKGRRGVLILILMEDTLRAMKRVHNRLYKTSLNPYSNGRYSERL